MLEAGVFQVKTHLSELLHQVERGERVRITRHGKTVAILIPPDEDGESDGSVTALRTLLRTRPLGSVKEISEWKKDGRR